MITVNEIDVRMTWGTEQHGIPRRPTASRVCGRVALPQISFNFPDPGGAQLPALPANQDFAQQIATHVSRIAIIKSTRQRFPRLLHRPQSALPIGNFALPCYSTIVTSAHSIAT